MKKIHTLTNIFLSFKIWKNRGSSFNQQEDELLCRVYLEISQDPIVSNNQALKQLCKKKIEQRYNETKYESWETRSSRSLQGRMCTILYAVRNLKSCVIQVENMHLSGASEHDIVSIYFVNFMLFIYMIFVMNLTISC